MTTDAQNPAVAQSRSRRKIRKKKKIIRNTEKPVQRYRKYIQIGFTALSIAIGVRFYFFMQYLESNGHAAWISRPPGVDAFLPISSMMSMYHFLTTGDIHHFHPAGLFIFLAIILVSLVIGRSFCSWICPVGFLSEFLGDFGERIFGKIKLPRWLDYPLRSLKYLLLGFFVYSIFFLMSKMAINAFLNSPYNAVADIKMYHFFANLSRVGAIVIAFLILASIFIRNFWCRYLCPYGALLGITSLLSPNKIKRNPESCIDCAKCAKVCPSFIKVDQVKTVWSDECSTCMSCVDVCPVADTLDLKSTLTKRKIPKKKIAIAVVAVFTLVTGVGMVTGHWQNDITKQEYLHHMKYLDSYGHPRGADDISKLNKSAQKNSSEKE